MGFIFSIIAGSLMSIQGVMNTRLSEKIGLFESNMFVQGTAFLLSLIVMWIWGKGSLLEITKVNRWYLLGGILGLFITVTVMLSMKKLNPTLAVSSILIAQLLTAAIIDAFGLMGAEKMTFGWNKYCGLILMLGGVLLFKFK
jgi:transporter family-2 protein